MNFLTQLDIEEMKLHANRALGFTKNAIADNVETLDLGRSETLENARAFMELAISELEDLTPSDPDSFPTGQESFKEGE